jgi:hypothetical protein
MKRNERRLHLLLCGIALAALAGCATKVLVPPRVELALYDKIGMIEFSSNAKGTLRRYASDKLLQSIQHAQPGVRILELGSEDQVLRWLHRDEIDFEAIQKIGERHGVDAVLIGRLDVTEVKPQIQVSQFLTSMSAQADVEATLSARLFETDSGATVWSRSARGREPVAHVKLLSDGPAHFGASDPEQAYGKLVHALVQRVTSDFRPRWVRH